jgi:hypothetical protein
MFNRLTLPDVGEVIITPARTGQGRHISGAEDVRSK